jgi:ABC-2 type transport system ATP-binding protein
MNPLLAELPALIAATHSARSQMQETKVTEKAPASSTPPAQAMQSLAVQVQNLRKSFGQLEAVRGVSFEVRQGEVFSLLGPNGAGKSTTISMLSCLLQPTSGDALVFGQSIAREQMPVKEAIGVVPQDIALYADLSATENLAFWGKMYGLRGKPLHDRIEEVLQVIGLTERRGGAVGKFSGGMKRRLNIGIALLHKPRLLILDEPTVGIDPQSRRSILDAVKALNRQGMTVLYTTHYMEEAQELSDRIAIMDTGQIVACGTHEELVKIVGEKDRVDLVISAEPERVVEPWRAVEGVRQVMVRDTHDELERAEGAAITLLVDDSNLVLPRLFDSAIRLGVRIISVEIQEPNLEAVFLHLTGRALRN